MTTDPSHGWEAIAEAFMAARSDAGAEVIRHWAEQLPPGTAVVDIGCGFGEPVTRTLIEAGLAVAA